MNVMAMEHAIDPATELVAKIGPLDAIEVFGNQILVAVYKRPEKTKGGIILSDQTRGEDEFQGKAGVVLKTGPLAFQNGEGVDFKGQAVRPGDWIAYRVSDGWSCRVNGVSCRLLEDVHVKLGLSSPDVIW